MSLEIRIGSQAGSDGRYLAFVEDDVLPDYAKPLCLMWHRGEWFYPMSDVKYRRKVWAWAGPLPVGKLAEIFPQSIVELAAAIRSVALAESPSYQAAVNQRAQEYDL